MFIGLGIPITGGIRGVNTDISFTGAAFPGAVSFTRTSLAQSFSTTNAATYGPNNLITTQTLASWTKSGTISLVDRTFTFSVTGGFANISPSVVSVPIKDRYYYFAITMSGNGSITLDGNGGINTTTCALTSTPTRFFLRVTINSVAFPSPRIISYTATASGGATEVTVHDAVVIFAAETYETAERSRDLVAGVGAAYYGPRLNNGIINHCKSPYALSGWTAANMTTVGNVATLTGAPGNFQYMTISTVIPVAGTYKFIACLSNAGGGTITLDCDGELGTASCSMSSIPQEFTATVTVATAGTKAFRIISYSGAGGTAANFTFHACRIEKAAGTIEARGFLNEPAATNIALYSRELTNAVWTSTNITAAKTQEGVDTVGSPRPSATLLTATAANGTCLQSVTLASSSRLQSAWVKRSVGTGLVEMTTDGGVTWTGIPVTSTWQRVVIPPQVVTNPQFGFRIATSGDAIAVDFVQNETLTTYDPSSEITTGASAITRSADSATFTAPAGHTSIRYTFDNYQVQDVAYVPGTVAIPTNLNFPNIRSISYV